MDFKGMTVNERLYVGELIEDYYKAVEEKNTERVIEILNKIEVGEGNIPPILKHHKLA